MSKKIEFNNLKAQYALLKETINHLIQTELDHGRYIMDPEFQKLGCYIRDHCNA